MPASLSIPFVFRDFISFPSMTTTLQRAPDFEARCVGQQQGGMVNATLDAEGKPVNSNACNLAAACTLTQGYVDPDLATSNLAKVQRIVHARATSVAVELHANHPIAGHPGDQAFGTATTSGVNKRRSYRPRSR